MPAIALRSEERIGLAVAVVAHVALVALLLLHPHSAPVVTPPDRVEVTLSDEVGLKSTSPEPQAEAAPDIAPDIGEPPQPEPLPVPPAPRLEPPKPEPPRPQLKPEPPRPVAKPTMRPNPRPSPVPSARPSAAPSEKPKARSITRPGGSRVGADFLKGVPGARLTGSATAQPASSVGASEKASLLAAISRKIRPNWRPPQGADAEKLVTVVVWNLNPDGSLNGAPRVVNQTGITDSNRPQAARHAELAVRAVELAAPFDLPPQYYNVWKRVGPINFDWKLAQ